MQNNNEEIFFRARSYIIVIFLFFFNKFRYLYVFTLCSNRFILHEIIKVV